MDTILGWPWDTFSVDFRAAADTGKGHGLQNFPHTVLLVFISGNPGLVEWYLPMFVQLVNDGVLVLRLGAEDNFSSSCSLMS
jgi:hypothetical protein